MQRVKKALAGGLRAGKMVSSPNKISPPHCHFKGKVKKISLCFRHIPGDHCDRNLRIEMERQRQIAQLLEASTPEKRKSIERGRRAGQKLRRELEGLSC